MKHITWGGIQCRYIETHNYVYEGDEYKYLLYEVQTKLIYLKWRKILKLVFVVMDTYGLKPI